MSFIDKNPIAGNTTTGPWSVTSLDRDYGTNFSIYNIGGYMEVQNLSDLQYTIVGTGNIFNSGNTIPIKFYKSPTILTDKVYLWNDGISSGRRRLGMLVFVQETQKTYQYTIDNYETLYDNADNAGCIIGDPYTDTFLEVRNKVGTTPNASGQALIDVWTGSTIEGISGVTRDNARWKIFWGTDWQLTGGTYNNTTGTLSLNNITGGTLEITGFTTGTTEDTYLTGATYDIQNKEVTLGMSDGTEFLMTGFSPTITGGTYSNGSITLYGNDGSTPTITGLEILTHIGTVTAGTVSASGTTIDSVDTTKYKGVFFDYVINDGTNYRAGTVQAVWDGSNIKHNDFSTVDIGNTTTFIWDMELSGNDALLKANITGGTWDIRIIKHII